MLWVHQTSEHWVNNKNMNTTKGLYCSINPPEEAGGKAIEGWAHFNRINGTESNMSFPYV